ncbi:MAG: hypothetical protein FJY92_07665, partial [Candidatus Hydrogenedentes bacterium]|nr:hypothetical protein [Candidatus Hydrogenedentota bacterium]
MKLILENVRCFSGRHQIPIRPLTLLVGENSSGKTTALAMLSVALSRSGFGFRPDFNKPPYDLGNFRTTVSLGKRRSDAEQFFSIGLEFADDAPTKLRTLHARFGDAEGQPNLRKLRVETVSGSVEIDASPERVRYVVTGGDTKFEFNAEMARHWQERGASLSELLFYSMFQRKYDRKR